MVNDIISIINSEKFKKVRGTDNDVKEIKKFIEYLTNYFSVNLTEAENKSKLFLINRKNSLKKAYTDANNVNELALYIAQIYAKIFTDFAKSIKYNNLNSLKSSVIRIQYKILKKELQEL